MNKVNTQEMILEDYSGIVSDQLLSEITRTAEKVKGLRIVHISSTPRGNAVSEILQSLIPLMCDVGINARWYALSPDEPFNRVTKMLHSCLQGGTSIPDAADIGHYLISNRKAAETLMAMNLSADIWMLHDVHVLPMLSYMDSCMGVWICHADTTNSSELIREMLYPYMSRYRTILAAMPEYFPNGNNPSEVIVFPPAIDPLRPRNTTLPFQEAKEILSGLGIDSSRPVICQVSNFDQWKDPCGVIDSFRLARKSIPGLQLALVGSMIGKDDPDARKILTLTEFHTDNDPDIHLFSDPSIIGEREVNAFQSGADIILQKSLREGFGLTVTEAMWKQRPVIGGNCGGIKHQIRDGLTGYLVNDVSMCANRIVKLINDRTLAGLMGSAARESVRRNYLMPRLLKDYLQLASTILEKPSVYAA